jgi:hypothetical protein
MTADDDGFVSPRKVMRMIGASADDLKVLILKRFIISFDSGVVVIKHWLISNTIREDRYHETTYKKELANLTKNEFGAYTEKKEVQQTLLEIEGIEKHITGDVVRKSQEPLVNDTTANRGQNDGYKKWQPNGNQMEPEPNLTKPNLNKIHTSNAIKIIDFWNECFGTKILVTNGRKQKIIMRMKLFNENQIKQAITNAHNDDFFMGGGDRQWKGTLDYLIKKDENLEKYLNIQNESYSRKDLEKYV